MRSCRWLHFFPSTVLFPDYKSIMLINAENKKFKKRRNRIHTAPLLNPKEIIVGGISTILNSRDVF